MSNDKKKKYDSSTLHSKIVLSEEFSFVLGWDPPISNKRSVSEALHMLGACQHVFLEIVWMDSRFLFLKSITDSVWTPKTSVKNC